MSKVKSAPFTRNREAKFHSKRADFTFDTTQSQKKLSPLWLLTKPQRIAGLLFHKTQHFHKTILRQNFHKVNASGQIANLGFNSG